MGNQHERKFGFRRYGVSLIARANWDIGSLGVGLGGMAFSKF